MEGRCEGRCQETGGEKLEECCKEQGQLAEASKGGLGSEWAVVPVMMMMIFNWNSSTCGAMSCAEYVCPAPVSFIINNINK
jgi:hypothetical protein